MLSRIRNYLRLRHCPHDRAETRAYYIDDVEPAAWVRLWSCPDCGHTIMEDTGICMPRG